MSKNLESDFPKPKKLKLMSKLQYGENYAGITFACVVVTVFVSVFWGPPAVIVPTVYFFYLAALQLYSGIGLDILGSWTGHFDQSQLIAKYSLEKEPTPFYFNVSLCLLSGVAILLWFVPAFFTKK